MVLFWASLAIFFVMVPVVTLYALGYRLDDSWNLKKTGGIYVSSDISGSEIFFEGNFEDRTNLLQSGAFIDNLSPGTYQVQVLNEGYQPWKKNLEVNSQLVTEARAILIPEKTNSDILLRGTFSGMYASQNNPIIILSETRQISTGIEKIVRWYIPEDQAFLTDTAALLKYNSSFEIVRWLPNGVILNLDNKRFRVSFNLGRGTASIVPMGNESPNKTDEEILETLRRVDDRESIEITYLPVDGSLTAAWIDEGIILPYYFQNEKVTIVQGEKIGNFELLPGRRDIVLASFDNAVWAIEIDARNPRATLPVYKGNEPEFAILPNNGQIYILDDGILMSVNLRTQ